MEERKRGSFLSITALFLSVVCVSSGESTQTEPKRGRLRGERERRQKKCVPARHASVLFSFCSASLLQSGLKGVVVSAHKDKKEQDMKRSRLDDITRKVKEGEQGSVWSC